LCRIRASRSLVSDAPLASSPPLVDAISPPGPGEKTRSGGVYAFSLFMKHATINANPFPFPLSPTLTYPSVASHPETSGAAEPYPFRKIRTGPNRTEHGLIVFVLRF
jgi:hypothetical protein